MEHAQKGDTVVVGQEPEDPDAFKFPTTFNEFSDMMCKILAPMEEVLDTDMLAECDAGWDAGADTDTDLEHTHTCTHMHP